MKNGFLKILLCFLLTCLSVIFFASCADEGGDDGTATQGSSEQTGGQIVYTVTEEQFNQSMQMSNYTSFILTTDVTLPSNAGTSLLPKYVVTANGVELVDYEGKSTFYEKQGDNYYCYEPLPSGKYRREIISQADFEDFRNQMINHYSPAFIVDDVDFLEMEYNEDEKCYQCQETHTTPYYTDNYYVDVFFENTRVVKINHQMDRQLSQTSPIDTTIIIFSYSYDNVNITFPKEDQIEQVNAEENILGRWGFYAYRLDDVDYKVGDTLYGMIIDNESVEDVGFEFANGGIVKDLEGNVLEDMTWEKTDGGVVVQSEFQVFNFVIEDNKLVIDYGNGIKLVIKK